MENNPEMVLDLIANESQLGRIAGPFDHQPFKQMHISPISIQPTKDSSKFRLIQDLSYPYNHLSVNGLIDDDSASVNYASILQAISMIMSSGCGCLLAKTYLFCLPPIPYHPQRILSVGILSS